MVPSLNLAIRSLQNTLLWIGTALGTEFPNKIGTGVMYSPQDSFNKQKKECQVPKGITNPRSLGGRSAMVLCSGRGYLEWKGRAIPN
jgi:hypothetical protein